jgi:hypothetical protein
MRKAIEARDSTVSFGQGVERIFLTVGIAKWPIRLRLQVLGKQALTCAQIPM